MILRTAMLCAMVVCTTSLAMADEVLYCTDMAVTGFTWDDTGKVSPTRFDEHRFTVKVSSGTQRTIAQMDGDIAGKPHTYTCHASIFLEDQIICVDTLGGYPWVFYKNNYTHAFLDGTPVGPPNSMDQNISVGYGTCTHF